MGNITSSSFRWTMDSTGDWLCIQTGKARQIIDGLTPGKVYDIEVKQHRERRSLDANAYFHVLVGKIADTLGIGFEECKTNLVTEYGAFERDSDGVKVGFKLPATVDVSKIYRYVKCFDTREENGKLFNCYIVFKHTHLMDTKEMSRLIDGAVFEAKELGIETLPPEKLAAMMERWNAQNDKSNTDPRVS